ncbi:hypothetical protein PVT71_14605 [Salipiger sp. H15]|uniref:Helix-turn-helix domain-containing protein n=1 Tax=Alloyangia sp. H15 TaxID=3029062 RepID=A0AAU8APB8_9RHOB
MALEFDLLGDPINPKRGEPGRNEHLPTAENANKVRTLLLSGLSLARIADEMGISAPTLRKHYFQNGKINRSLAREMALAEARAKNLLQLQKAADGGNVSAMKEMRQILDREHQAELDARYRREAAAAGRAAPKGKKEITRAAALQAEEELDALFDNETRH